MVQLVSLGLQIVLERLLEGWTKPWNSTVEREKDKNHHLPKLNPKSSMGE